MVKEVILSFVHFKKDAIPHVTDATAVFFGPNVDNSFYFAFFIFMSGPRNQFNVWFLRKFPVVPQLGPLSSYLHGLQRFS